MKKRPLYFISREKEFELIQKLIVMVDNSAYDPETTCVIMASPDYSATVAMHLTHAWSNKGNILPIIPVDVTYPDEQPEPFIEKMKAQKDRITKYSKIVMVEAGIIRGGNWKWMLDVLYLWGFKRSDIVLVALCENIGSKIKSDYVAEYYDNEKEDLTFYFEKYNKHWPV